MRLGLVALAATVFLSACGGGREEPAQVSRLYPGETVEMRLMIHDAAEELDIPEALLHRVIQRESDYRANARNGPYYGLMQILPQTARTMGFRGQPNDLLDPRVNLRYAGRYLRGAWIVSDGNMDAAVMHYARGYYYDARDRCLLVETGLAQREVNRRCR
ncbi:lytic transglycosylase domain-containing protein [Pararhodobacter sp. CCB-MM2]|uniref:lytic transglycosylase domain-containing protein n=1 Tax=Pararhodobacter sp. CCB-MM2 TaxID=1786003 RepID=UPI000836FA05|nr:lytic transglycosylase domain-containing protein [Pararhodobacter sp. CCB-MM2]